MPQAQDLWAAAASGCPGFWFPDGNRMPVTQCCSPPVTAAVSTPPEEMACLSGIPHGLVTTLSPVSYPRARALSYSLVFGKICGSRRTRGLQTMLNAVSGKEQELGSRTYASFHADRKFFSDIQSLFVIKLY